MKVKVTMVQFLEIAEDADGEAPDFDAVHDSLVDSYNDGQGSICETSDGKFEYEPGVFEVLKIEQVVE